MRREQVDPVVAPPVNTREFGHRHQLDDVDAQVGKVRHALDRPGEGSVGREGADMHLVQDRALERPTGPTGVRPRVCVMIDELGQTEHPIRLGWRSRIGADVSALERKAITRSRPGTGVRCRPPSAITPGHRGAPFVDEKLHALSVGGPQLEAVHQASSRVITTTGKSWKRLPSSTARPPRYRFPVKMFVHDPRGRSISVSAQSPPRPATSRGTTTSSDSRVKQRACRALVPVAWIGV